MIIGITGGSGCGKSEVSRIFRKCGVPVIDADTVARTVTEKGSPALDKIKECFGEEYISEDGGLLRKKLGELVFSDKEALELLNSIIGKYIMEEINNELSENQMPAIGLDAPLLIEYGLFEKCDNVIAVLSDKEKRISRIMARDLLSFENAENRINSQKSDDFYIEKADFIVYNNGTKENLEEDCRRIIKELKL